MKKLTMIFIGAASLMITAVTAAAQAQGTAPAESGTNLKPIAAVFGFAIAAAAGAIGQSRIGAAAVEGAARNPGAASVIQTMLILGLALIESLVLFALLIVFVKA